MERIYKAADTDNERPDRQQLDAHFAYWNVSSLLASSIDDKKGKKNRRRIQACSINPFYRVTSSSSFLSLSLSFFLHRETRESRKESSNVKGKLFVEYRDEGAVSPLSSGGQTELDL